jgi:hypothetical protein
MDLHFFASLGFLSPPPFACISDPAQQDNGESAGF